MSETATENARRAARSGRYGESDAAAGKRADAFRAQQHGGCVACDPLAAAGLRLRFQHHSDGSVTAEFACAEKWRGYRDRLHGGVVAMLLDSAMTNCLFAREIAGVTARMDLRFRQPVGLEKVAKIRAHIERSEPPLYILKAEICQNGQICAAATGKFYAEA